MRTLSTPTRGDVLDILRRDDVEPFLLVHHEDVEPTPWMRALRTTTIHRVHYSSIDQVSRSGDSVNVGVETYVDGERRAVGGGYFFDMYSQLDSAILAQAIGADDLEPEDRYRAAALAAAAGYLGVNVIVTNAPSAGRADVADNDVVVSVTPHELIPIFGHYLRATGNHNFRITTGGIAGGWSWTRTSSAGSLVELYAAGVDSGMVYFECLTLVAVMKGDAVVTDALHSIRTRLGRAARALDALLASLTNIDHPSAKPIDVTEAAAEAFDRELLYLCSACDGYGRLYASLIDTRIDPDSSRDTLTSQKFLEKTLPRYPGADVEAVEASQRFAHVISTLRTRIHSAVLPAGQHLSRAYGSAKTVALELDGIDYFDAAKTTLEQAQIDRLGVWWAEPVNALEKQTYVADLATIATTLMVTSLEYIDAFSRLILCEKPTDAPHPHIILGFAPDTGLPLPTPSEDELYHRRLFGWHGGVSVATS